MSKLADVSHQPLVPLLKPLDYVYMSLPAYMPTVTEVSCQKQDYVLQILYHALFKIALKVNPCVILVMVTTGWDSRMVWVKLRY